MSFVKALFTGRVTGGPMQAMQEVRLVAGAGIEGDRYAANQGTFTRGRSRKGRSGLDLTLIEQEAIDEVRKRFGLNLDGETTRRNVVTSGVRLDALVGQDFQLGSALVRGVAVNPPCSRLEKLTGISGLKRAMTGKGGIRADVIRGGVVRVGDPLMVPAGEEAPVSFQTKASRSYQQGAAHRSGRS